MTEFREAMAAAGLVYGGEIIADSKLHRFKVEGARERDSWYVLHSDAPIAGSFGCWKRGIKEDWCHRNGKSLSQDEWSAIRARWQQAERERKQSEAEAQSKARQTAQWILDNSSPVSGHSYLAKKGVGAYGAIRGYKGTLVLPLRDAYGTLHTAQFINSDGSKKFLSGGRCAGVFYPVALSEDGPLVICEGYATGASIHQAAGYSVVCAMNAGNLLAVARSMRLRYPDRELIIAADDDQATKGNPGITKATEAAKETGARLAVPAFSDVNPERGTDFNDLHSVSGIAEVRRQIDSAALSGTKAKSLFDLESRRDSDPGELIKDRYLCKGGGLLLVAPTGVGKSVLEMQMQISFSLGLECFGIRPARPLSSLLIQAENDDGDLAEMRDGIIHGLRLSAQDIDLARGRTFVESEDSKTGAELIALADAKLQEHKPDLLILDPALSYLGGDALSQKDVGGFLRNRLNPILHKHRCACIIVHHTNKPAAGKEKSEWQAGDFAYLGAGSAEWANWARAVLALRSIGSHDVYELRAGKRGARIGWKDKDGKTTYARLIGHSAEPGFIYWRDASEDELDRGGRPRDYTENDLLELLPDGGLTSTEWQDLAKTECGIKERRFYQLVKCLKDNGRILKSKVNSKWQPIKKRA